MEFHILQIPHHSAKYRCLRCKSYKISATLLNFTSQLHQPATLSPVVKPYWGQFSAMVVLDFQQAKPQWQILVFFLKNYSKPGRVSYIYSARELPGSYMGQTACRWLYERERGGTLSIKSILKPYFRAQGMISVSQTYQILI